MVVAFSIVCASAARSESKNGNTGIAGVIMVTPIRPRPANKGSNSECRSASKRNVSRYEQRGSRYYFHDRHGGFFDTTPGPGPCPAP